MSADTQITQLIEEVNKRKAEIAKADRPQWKTNCSFSYDEQLKNNALNLQVTTSREILVKIAGFIIRRQESFDKAAKQVGAEGVKFSWQGFSSADWLEDIKTRLVKLQITTKQKKLDELESRLNKLISPELRAKMELEAITKELVSGGDDL